MDRFPVPKRTGTHADVFAAVGLADLLLPVARCTIAEFGHEFCVKADREITNELCNELEVSAGYRFLRPNEKTPVPDSVKDDYVDYPAEKARAARYNQARMDARKAGSEVAEEIAADAPRPDWRLYQALNALQGDDATNKVVLTILSERSEDFTDLLWTNLQAIAAGERTATKWPAALVQLFAPHAAKGYARLKPDSTDRNDKTKDAWAEPFWEWLKYRGYFRVACPYFLGSKGENIRLLCPVPRSIDAQVLTDVAADVRKRGITGSAPKLDCLGVLSTAEMLIQHTKVFQAGGFNPAQLISGVMVTHYQSMGQAKAVAAMEQLALPDWFTIRTSDDVNLWLTMLEEHKVVIRSLRDDRSDEIGLILQYRRYLERRGSKALFSLAVFLEQYGIFLVREREGGRRLRQFQTIHVEKVFMQQEDYARMLRDPGFLAVADAIRSATVSAQAMKSMKRPDYREIRYDLLPDLRRKRTLPGTGPFIEAVSEFIASYNAESARRLELGKKSGMRRVMTEDLNAFVDLVSKQKDASVIGALLCAYATCREPRQETEMAIEEAPTTEETNVEA